MQHGDINRSFDPAHPHSDFHVHRADEGAIEAGLVAEKNAAKTLEYASFEEALRFFVKEINLNSEDAQKHFQRMSQASFTFEG